MNEYIVFVVLVSLLAFVIGYYTGKREKTKFSINRKISLLVRTSYRIGVLSERKYPNHIKLSKKAKYEIDNKVIKPPSDLFILEDMNKDMM